ARAAVVAMLASIACFTRSGVTRLVLLLPSTASLSDARGMAASTICSGVALTTSEPVSSGIAAFVGTFTAGFSAAGRITAISARSDDLVADDGRLDVAVRFAAART